VEKILEPGERLPAWPIAGTTGYDALAEVTAVLLDPAAVDVFDAIYREETSDERTFADHVQAGKRLVATTILRSEINRLAWLVPDIENATAALTELLIAIPVYRSYLPDGAEHLAAAIAVASARRPDVAAAIDALAPRLANPADELCVRFQQTSGAIMAKGVEDTAYYRYNRFVALNEVGGDPADFGCELAQFHAAQQIRHETHPEGMTTLSTHDTKRAEDVRARLIAIAEYPAEWSHLVRWLMSRAPMPNRSLGYLLWQTFVGAGLIPRERMHQYAEKAMREASDGTSWVDPDADFERAVHDAVDGAYDMPELQTSLEDFIALVEPMGWSNSLAQKLIQLTMPGVPDVYQGCELWDDSLVDPDNRRPVDFARRAALLASLDRTGSPPAVDATGAAKLWLVAHVLRLRRDRPELFTDYTPLYATGPAAEHAVAFHRGGAITVTTRLPAALVRAGGWRGTVLPIGGDYTDVLTGRRLSGPPLLGELLTTYPVALLVRR
jgi:(1->4)-alpha-D-glucan 1-alpha-D-glucosylmutase